MAKSSTEKDLAVLRELRAGGRGAAAVGRLRELLRGRQLHGMVMKMAAGLAEEMGARERAGDLTAVIEGWRGAGAGFLWGGNLGVGVGVAVAVGERGVAGALEVLAKAWPMLRGTGMGSTVLMAIGLVRSEEAMEWLVDQMGSAGASGAREYVDA